MQYSIWIVDSWPGVPGHTRCFEEVAVALQAAFTQLGYEVPIVHSHEDAVGRVIVLGSGVLERHKNITLPKDMIIYNFEQVHDEARFFVPSNPYIHYLRDYPVWDYSQNNIDALAARGVTDVTMCGVGYMPELTCIEPVEKQDIDVLFIGSMHPRRKQLLDELTGRGLRVEAIENMYGKPRDQMIARSKVLLNVHLQPANVFEIVRVSYLLANRKCVISEVGDDKRLEGPYKEAVVFSEYDTLVDACVEYVSDDAKRRKQEEAGFAIFSGISQVPMLEAALKESETNNIVQDNVADIFSTAPSQRTIFVNIASYRDPEIDATIRSLFVAAKYPDRIHVGVSLQIDEKTDAMCTINSDRPWQVRVRQVHYEDSKGANWARHQAQQLWQGEDYVLQIDSHMRFADEWDERMIDMLESCPSEKAVLSTYVPRYVPPDNRYQPTDLILRIRIHMMGEDNRPQLLHLTKTPVPLGINDPRAGLYPCPFYIANFLFCHGSTVEQLPFDPHIKFWGDEITYSARLWTHGFDIYQPHIPVIWHYWRRDELVAIQPYRGTNSKASELSTARIKHLLGLQTSNNEAALIDIEKYGLGTERELEDLWDFAGVDWKKRTLSKMSKEGRWNMAARDKAKKTATKKTAAAKKKKVPAVKKTTAKKAAAKTKKNNSKALRRILVQIPSYRDLDCQNTVKDLFDKAAHPERIFVGIAWQFIEGEDDACFEVPYPYPDQVRVHESDARESRGMCWARNQTQKLWQGEEFTLSMDAHMRFEEGWDDIVLGMWDGLEDERGILSAYPAGFVPPDTYTRGITYGMAVHNFEPDSICYLQGKPVFEPGKNVPEKPVPGAFIGDCGLFGPSSIIEDVPFDPHLYFFGQEISVSVRLWTAGYNIYHPNKAYVYHDWDRDKRKTHFTDHSNWGERDKRAFKRVRHLLGSEISNDPEITVELDQYGLGKVRTLEEYQNYSGVNFATNEVQDFAREGIFPHPDGRKSELQLTAEQANPATEERASIEQMTSVDSISKESGVLQPAPSHFVEDSEWNITKPGAIFINIASYRDPECQHTIRDLFERANNPERVFVGVCWQFDEEEDANCFEVVTRPEQVRIFPIDWSEAEGVCWARHRAQQLWDGEEYVLMIDSHMRFVEGWDDLMIQELEACPAEKPLLSCSPTPYFPPNKLGQNMNPTIRRVKPFMPDGNIRCQGEALDRSPEQPLRGAFLVANFVFSRSEIIKEVPYDPYLYFDQEEITYAARLYTHGWSVYSSRRQFLYHYYNDPKVPGGSVRPLHWRDLGKADEARIRYLRDRGLRRFNHMTGYEMSSDYNVTQELGKFGWGNVHTLDEFEKFSGVDFKNKIASERALRCEFIENLKQYRQRPIFIPELDKPQNVALGNQQQQQRMAAQRGGRRMMPHMQDNQRARDNTAVDFGGNNGQFQPQRSNNAPGGTVVPMQQAGGNKPDLSDKIAPRSLLDIGDFMPMLEVLDTNFKLRAIEVFGGKHSLFFCLPSHDMAWLTEFFKQLQRYNTENGQKDYWQMFILDTTPERLVEIKEQLQLPHVLFADPNRVILRSLGVVRLPDPMFDPVGYVLDNNMKIVSRTVDRNPQVLARRTVEECITSLSIYADRNKTPQIFTRIPPALVVPNSLSKELCEKCVLSFRRGHTFEGTVGAAEKKSYRPDTKIRVDHVPSAELTAEIDDKLSRSLFPEVKKIFGIDITHREQYKIGCYLGEKEGFFKAHRDNFDNPLGYRRFAATIHLSEDYEGGGLHFPEYDENVYKPDLGSTILFSCATQHEALPVTKGERFVLVAFFHGQQDEAYRHFACRNSGTPINPRDFVPTRRIHQGVLQSRRFYDEWQKEHVSYGAGDKLAQLPTQTPQEHNQQFDQQRQQFDQQRQQLDKQRQHVEHQRQQLEQQRQELEQQQRQLEKQRQALAQKQQASQSLDITDDSHKTPSTQPKVMINLGGNHQPVKIYDGPEGLVFDDFLSDESYDLLLTYTQRLDYEYINTTGKVSRAWHVHDGFPLRSSVNAFHYPEGTPKPPGEFTCPTNTPFDLLLDQIDKAEPHINHIIDPWDHISTTAWLYPKGTGLAIHDDGAGVYAGAYAYFANPFWKPHWGGHLMIIDKEANDKIKTYGQTMDNMEFFKSKWLHANDIDEIAMNNGIAKCIFPKRNRIAFIANDSYHMVTKVQEEAGDNVRMTLAGFFDIKK